MQRAPVAVADTVVSSTGDGRALRHGVRAARVEAAPASASRSARGTTPGIDASRSPGVARLRDRREQPLGVRVARAREQLLDRRLLHDLARVHHDHARAEVGDDAEVVGDEDHRHARCRACSDRMQVEDLGLDRDVERGGRLVGDEQPRLARQRERRAARAGACRPTAGAGSRRSRRSGSGMPTSSSSSRRACCAAALLIVRCRRIVSTSCVPMVNAGFRLVIGSWNTIAIWSPRSSRISLNDSDSRSRPSNITEPPVIRPGGDATSRITASDDTVLPEPDSPTSATTSPGVDAEAHVVDDRGRARARSGTPPTGPSTARSASVAGGGGAWSAGRVTVVSPRRPFMRLLALGQPEAERVADAVAEGVEGEDVNTSARPG